MSRIFLSIAAHFIWLALLAWIAASVVSRTTQSWFDKDISLRENLVINGARQTLLAHWEDDNSRAIQRLLEEMTHDERIMAAAVCKLDLSRLAATADYPSEFSCSDLAPRMRLTADSPPEEWKAVSLGATLPGGRVHMSAIPFIEQNKPLGFIVLIHDMAYIARRDAKMKELILIAFALLAGFSSFATFISMRFFWRGWTKEMRAVLRGGRERSEFQPILRDVRELTERLLSERVVEEQSGTWTPQRLKHTLMKQFSGEKIVVLANREPYIHDRGADGAIQVLHPASGLVTALEPVMRACGGVWIAHGGGSADRETADKNARLRVPPGEESYILRRVWLSSEEERGYYYGFANEGLWPLCHIADVRPVFRADDWKHYANVNQRFADAVCEEVDSEDPIIFVQDYHFALVPRLIRKRLPYATIISFWHIPWPNSERFGICPWREELLYGMLGSSILGFHTQLHCNNFLDAVDRFLEARIDRERISVVYNKRETLLRAYPISLEWPNQWVAQVPSPEECRASVYADLKLAPDTLLGFGVDRLDYTKGVEERLLAVSRLLERIPSLCGRFVFVQLAAPSRTAIERYRELNATVERIAAEINERFSSGSYRPIILVRAHQDPVTIFRYYRAAHLCYVSSLHDGMNLVAKEFVSARDDEQGVLILSSFTGAAKELTEALIVNPYDLDEASAALAAALSMSQEEQRDRMRAMRALLAEFNVYRWAGRMLVDASRVRGKDRLSARLGDQSVALQ